MSASPVDIFAVKEYGVARWREEFSWPVSDGEFRAMALDIEELWARLISSESQAVSDVLLARFALTLEYSHIFHSLQVIQGLGQKDVKALYSSRALWYPFLLTGKGEEKYGVKLRSRAASSASAQTVLNDLKRSVKNIILNAGKSSPRHDGLALGSGELFNLYRQRLPYKVEFASPDRFIPPSGYPVPDDKALSGVGTVTDKIMAGLEQIAVRHGILLVDGHRMYLRRLTERVLSEGIQDRTYLMDCAVEKARHLLVTGLGNPSRRMLCVALRRKGGRVTGFSHGGAVGLYDTTAYSWAEFALCDEFVTYTSASVPLLERIRDRHPAPRGHRTDITSPESEEYLRIWSRWKNTPPRKDVRTVMLVGFPHNQFRKYQVAGGLSSVQLELELRMVDALKAAGYKVLYKVHPDRVAEAEGIFGDLVTGHLEDCHEMADALVFGCIRSTAFPFSLCTNKHVVALRISPEPYPAFEEPMRLLEKRCRFVPAKMDDRQRIIFDKKAFLEAVACPSGRPDGAFVETYLCPGSGGQTREMDVRETVKAL